MVPFYFIYYNSFYWPVLLISVTLISPETAALFFEHKQNCTAHTKLKILLFSLLWLTSLRTLDKASDTSVRPHMLHTAKPNHCRSITLSKCLLMTLDGLPSKRLCQLVLWCVLYHHFTSSCVSLNVQLLAKQDPMRQTDDWFLFTVSF